MYWDDSVNVTSWWPTKTWNQLVTKDDDTSYDYTIFFNERTQSNNNKKNILVGWIGGQHAQRMEQNLSEEEILHHVMNNLQQMFIDVTIPSPTKYRITNWGQDEFSKGSYSYDKVGIPSSRFRRELRQRTGNLFWSGEATHTSWYSTTTGAYKSGTSVAKEIVEYLL